MSDTDEELRAIALATKSEGCLCESCIGRAVALVRAGYRHGKRDMQQAAGRTESKLAKEVSTLRKALEDAGQIIAANMLAAPAAPQDAERERQALVELLKLSNHYATLLNEHDGGTRLTFATPDAWMERLATVKES